MQQLGKLIEMHGYYDGSRIFTWLGDLCGLSVDLVSLSNFVAFIGPFSLANLRKKIKISNFVTYGHYCCHSIDKEHWLAKKYNRQR